MNGLCMPTALALKQAGLEYLLLGEAQAQAIRGGAPAAALQPESPGLGPPAAQVSPTARAPARELREKDWPAVWRERLNQVHAAPVIWTYWELGLDMCAAPDPQRRDLVKRLLKCLAHPGGTHCFWPLALPGGEGGQQLEANPPVFWEGVRRLHGRAVVIMGSQALRSLAMPDRLCTLRPYQQGCYQGRQLIVLPSPVRLIREAEPKPALQRFLRNMLAQFATFFTDEKAPRTP